MSEQLSSSIENAQERLRVVLPAVANGEIASAAPIHGIGILFRQIGVCRMLLEGAVEPLFIAQMQSSSCYDHALHGIPEHEKATSRAGCLWDALAGSYWDAAASIGRKSRTTFNPDYEHEDDFLRVAFTISRYLRQPDLRDSQERLEEQHGLLTRWEQVLDGTPDPLLDVARALANKDEQGFADGFLMAIEERRAKLDAKQLSGALLQEQTNWITFFWPEALALLRLAEREGFSLYEDYSMVPRLTRADNLFVYDANAWRSLEFQPARNAS